MRNPYLENLRRIEFSVTTACNGKCIHCQNGDPGSVPVQIDAKAAVGALRAVCGLYPIDTVMTFGGEPLLCPDTVCAIHRTARQLGIAKRQVITNGYVSKNPERIEKIVRDLSESGVNDLLLSVDAFHQETIPLEPVMTFAGFALRRRIPIRLSPAWLVSREDENPYNGKTREILRTFEAMGIEVGEGNVVFPSGRALTYLREYFGANVTESSPYDEDPCDIRSLSFEPNGNVLHGNIHKTDILDILSSYRP